jgi:hypothetical protein
LITAICGNGGQDLLSATREPILRKYASDIEYVQARTRGIVPKTRNQWRYLAARHEIKQVDGYFTIVRAISVDMPPSDK